VKRYVCEFVNKSGRRRTIVVELDGNETSGPEDPDAIVAKACALRRAYHQLPRGFLHDSVRAVTTH
jgi:hypothetical protein